MKRFIAICLLLFSVAGGISAQNAATSLRRVEGDSIAETKSSTKELSRNLNVRKGFWALGADLDSLQYVIASPFDNWFVGFGVGAQTFIGNELYATARRNKLDGQAYVEVGKWLIPDLSVSVVAKGFTVQGQTRYGRHPFVDFTGNPVSDGHNLDYQPFLAKGVTLGFHVTMDWVNLFCGYQLGSTKRVHVMTPIGLGGSMLFGSQINPISGGGYKIGDFRRNYELYFDASLLVEYEVSPHVALDFSANLVGSESTWDWSPYDNSYGIFDVMPSISAGVRLNLFKTLRLRDENDQPMVQQVNHVFLPASTERIEILRERIDTLNNHIGQLRQMGDIADDQIDRMMREIDSLQNRIYNLEQDAIEGGAGYAGNYPHRNKMDQFIDLTEKKKLAKAIVYFPLDRYNLDYNARKTIQNFVTQIRQMPDTIRFYIIGAADSATGTQAHNQELSEHRCLSVYNLLTMTYGIDPSRLEMCPLGGIYEYDPDEMNRVGIVVMRDDELTKLIDKWKRHAK